MHIPDGYLSPSTCAVLYVGAATGWYSALKRLKRVLLTRVIPLISVFAAFSFVVMMFNLPLPGGTTGHALGVTIAAIVLGPSGAILAISIAHCHSGPVLRRWRNQHAGRELLQHGHRGLAGSVCQLQDDGSRLGSGLQTSRGGSGSRRISCGECRSFGGCYRVRHPADAVSRRRRDAVVCAISASASLFLP